MAKMVLHKRPMQLPMPNRLSWSYIWRDQHAERVPCAYKMVQAGVDKANTDRDYNTKRNSPHRVVDHAPAISATRGASDSTFPARKVGKSETGENTREQ